MPTCPTCYRGSCEITHDVAKCVCEARWYLSDCRKHNCNGNGYSEIINGQAVCNCHNGWHGDLCQLENEIAGEKCVNGRFDNGRCYCHENYQGIWCDQQIPRKPCSRDCGNGSCYMGSVTDEDYCACNPGFSGPNCKTLVCDDRCLGKSCRIINNYAYCYTEISKPGFHEEFMEARRMKSNAKTPSLFFLFQVIFVLLK